MHITLKDCSKYNSSLEQISISTGPTIQVDVQVKYSYPKMVEPSNDYHFQ